MNYDIIIIKKIKLNYGERYDFIKPRRD